MPTQEESKRANTIRALYYTIMSKPQLAIDNEKLLSM